MSRTKTIKIRLTETEHSKLKVLAGTRGVSALLRVGALGTDRREQQSDRLWLLTELARFRVILNQIARRSERCQPTEQILILSQLIAVERSLLRLNPPC